jgi:hypothetical protein
MATTRPQRQSSQEPDADEEFTPKLRAWWVPWLVAAVVAALVVGIGSFFVHARGDTVASMEMGGDTGAAAVPAVTGFHAGDEVRFVHTEASDPQVAAMLTDVMGSQVVVVPALAGVPDSTLADVYVFTNGVQPDGEAGPFGFQPDVFDSVPGDPGYSPLRAVNLVTWTDRAEPRGLRSVADIEATEAAGDIDIDRPGVVVNMPIVDWVDGGR